MSPNPRVLAAIYGPNGEVLTVTRGNAYPYPYRIRGTANLDIEDLDIPTQGAVANYAIRAVERQKHIGDTVDRSTADQIDIIIEAHGHVWPDGITADSTIANRALVGADGRYNWNAHG